MFPTACGIRLLEWPLQAIFVPSWCWGLEPMCQSSLWPDGKISSGPGQCGEASQERCGAMGEAGSHDPPCPLSPRAPCCQGWAGERQSRASSVPGAGTLLGWLRLSSDAILWCSRRPSLPDAMACLHVLCSLPCSRLCHDLRPLRSSLAAALARPLGSVPWFPAWGRELLGSALTPLHSALLHLTMCVAFPFTSFPPGCEWSAFRGRRLLGAQFCLCIGSSP